MHHLTVILLLACLAATTVAAGAEHPAWVASGDQQAVDQAAALVTEQAARADTFRPGAVRAVGPWPTGEQLGRVLLLRDYNTRVVVLGTTLLGLASGVVGTFMLLRKRALMSDALSHATLPGIALAFIVSVMLGGQGKHLLVLLTGAMITGVLGVGCVLLIRHATRLKEDAALGIVLSVFFGAGVALLGVVQKMQFGSAAGLETFIYGKTASMLAGDAWLIAAAAVVGILGCVVLFKEFALICFDQQYAATQGWPILGLDVVMMTLVTLITVIGLQAVGLILMIALLIIPPAAARFWTDRLWCMMVIAAVIGALSGWLGASLSALTPRLPAGAVIVVVAAGLFVISLLAGPSRGLVRRLAAHLDLQRKIGRQNLLRALYELGEHQVEPTPGGISLQQLLAVRSWSRRQLRGRLRDAERTGHVRQVVTEPGRDNGYWLTRRGQVEAARVVRNHRLWEMYLMTHADVAAAMVDRDADRVEHVLGKELVSQLEAMLQQPGVPVPASPHEIAPGARSDKP